MPGLGEETWIVFETNGVITYLRMSTWIDGLLTANSSSVTQENAWTEKYILPDTSLQVYYTDQNGFQFKSPITAVYRIDKANLPLETVYQMRIINNMSPAVSLLSDTPICTRYENRIHGQNASDFAVGDYMCLSLVGYTVLAANSVFESGVQINNTLLVPGIVTTTWGGPFLLTRNDCQAALIVCESYPDVVDPNDWFVFNAVVSENTMYSAISRMDVVTTHDNYPFPHYYWIDTEAGAFQIYGQACQTYGHPPPGFIYDPNNAPEVIQEALKVENAERDTGKAQDLLKQVIGK